MLVSPALDETNILIEEFLTKHLENIISHESLKQQRTDLNREYDTIKQKISDLQKRINTSRTWTVLAAAVVGASAPVFRQSMIQISKSLGFGSAPPSNLAVSVVASASFVGACLLKDRFVQWLHGK